MKGRMLLLSLAVGWLLVSCANAATLAEPATPTATPTTAITSTAAPAATPTTAVTPTVGPIVWSGDHAPIQMELIATITGSPEPFSQVRGLALDQQGDLYVVDTDHSRVLKYDRTGKFLIQWGSQGTGDGQFVMTGGPANTGNSDGSVAVDPLGNVYVTDNSRIQKFDSQGKFLTGWGSAGTGDGQFNLMTSIAIDPHNDVYVTDIGNDVVQKFDGSGKFLLKWGGHGPGEGQFIRPMTVTFDTQGNVLVADGGTGRLQKFDRSGKFLSQVVLGAVDHVVIGPLAMAVGNQGQIYIGEFANGRVVEFDSSGKLLAAWGSPDTYQVSSNILAAWGNTAAYQEQMSEVGGLALDQDGSLYAADTFNNRVLKFRQH